MSTKRKRIIRCGYCYDEIEPNQKTMVCDKCNKYWADINEFLDGILMEAEMKGEVN